MSEYCSVYLGISFVVSLGLMVWLYFMHLKLLLATATLVQWRGKAVTGEVLRSRDAFVKAVEDEAERPRDYRE